MILTCISYFPSFALLPTASYTCCSHYSLPKGLFDLSSSSLPHISFPSIALSTDNLRAHPVWCSRDRFNPSSRHADGLDAFAGPKISKFHISSRISQNIGTWGEKQRQHPQEMKQQPEESRKGTGKEPGRREPKGLWWVGLSIISNPSVLRQLLSRRVDSHQHPLTQQVSQK